MSKLIVYYGATASFSNLYSNNLGGVNEFVTLGDNDAFSFTDGAGNDSPFSGSVWIKRNATGHASLICKAQVLSTSQEYFFVLLSNRLYFWIADSGGTGDRVGRYTTVTITNDGNWHHCVFTYSGNNAASGIKLYIDDVQRDTTNFNSGVYDGMINTTAPVRIGTANESITWSTNGLIAHPCMFNKELSATEVTELYNLKMGDLRTTSFAANTIFGLYYPTGIGDYATWTDYVNTYDGTMTNQEDTDIDSDVPV